LGFLGPVFNSYFKSLLVKSTQILPGVTLRRQIVFDLEQQKITIKDTVTGLVTNDELRHSPPWSLRLVPSAKFYQDGEATAFIDRSQDGVLTERIFTKSIDING